MKAYGEMLVEQHTANDHTLKGFVKQTHQIIPPVKPASDVEKQARAEEKATIAKLKTLKGADFDREYLRMMVDGHEKELAGIGSRWRGHQPAAARLLSARNRRVPAPRR